MYQSYIYVYILHVCVCVLLGVKGVHRHSQISSGILGVSPSEQIINEEIVCLNIKSTILCLLVSAVL